MRKAIPIPQKYLLTVNEAAEYFNIGVKKIRRLAEDHLDSFAVIHGNRYLIIRESFEEYVVSCLKTEDGGNTL